MTTPIESTIRDALAEDLRILEPGLELVAKEYKLPNTLGGKGFVDILARDRFGTLVVIELKRSDAAARQALHELFKYTALLRQNHGLGDDAVRCLILSTDWHELLVPFSELAANAPFHVDRYKLEVNADATQLSAEQVTPVDLAEALELCPSGFVFLYESADGRREERPEIERATQEVGIDDYLLVEQDYTGDNPGVIYPYCDAFLITMLSPSRHEELAQRSGLTEDELEEIGNPWYLEEMVLSELTQAMSQGSPMDIEILYPDKFRAHEELWPVKEIRRHGARLESELRTDDELLSMVRGNVGGVSSQYERFATPRVDTMWRKVRDDVRQCLTGNEAWLELVDAYLDQREASQASGVAINIFNPCDLVMSLFKLGAEGSPAYLPSLQIVSEPDPPEVVDAAIGFVEWNGTTRRADPQELLSAFFDGEITNYFIRRTVGEAWQLEDELLKWHGLSCVLYGARFTGEDAEWSHLRVADGMLATESASEGDIGPQSMLEFVSAHMPYLMDLVSLVRSHSMGL